MTTHSNIYTKVDDFLKTRNTLLDLANKSQFCFIFFDTEMKQSEEFCSVVQKGQEYNYFKIEELKSMDDLGKLNTNVCYIDCTKIDKSNAKNLAIMGIADRDYFKPELGAVTYFFMYNEESLRDYAQYNSTWGKRAFSTYLETSECMALIEKNKIEVALKPGPMEKMAKFSIKV